jgi:hypothetical protein
MYVEPIGDCGVWVIARAYGPRDVPHQRRCPSPLEVWNFEAELPAGTYVLEQKGNQVIVWRISEGEPEAEAYVPLLLYEK